MIAPVASLSLTCWSLRSTTMPEKRLAAGGDDVLGDVRLFDRQIRIQNRVDHVLDRRRAADGAQVGADVATTAAHRVALHAVQVGAAKHPLAPGRVPFGHHFGHDPVQGLAGRRRSSLPPCRRLCSTRPKAPHRCGRRRTWSASASLATSVGNLADLRLAANCSGPSCDPGRPGSCRPDHRCGVASARAAAAALAAASRSSPASAATARKRVRVGCPVRGQPFDRGAAGRVADGRQPFDRGGLQLLGRLDVGRAAAAAGTSAVAIRPSSSPMLATCHCGGQPHHSQGEDRVLGCLAVGQQLLDLGQIARRA